MAYLEIRNLTKKYKDFTLSSSLSAEEGEFLSVIGPSGSGKSTLLSLIAGLDRPDSGAIELAGQDITDAPIQTRGIGMVFQDYTLFPSMNVGKNIQAGMKNRSRKEKGELTEQLLSLVGLEGYSKRSVSSLSGGEAQRIALARAIAAEPKLMLFDEPLSALDAPMRKHLRAVIRGIHDSLGITMIYVTHDTEEAFAISDSIAIMQNGVITQKKSVEDTYRHPENIETAFFVGEGTAIDASLIDEEKHGYAFFRPESVNITEQSIREEDYPNYAVFNDAEVVSAEFTGADYLLGIEWNGYQILARTSIRPRRKNVSMIVLKAAIIYL